MNDTPVPHQRRSPLGQLILARLREFYREPEAIFWVYFFPILIVVALGIAFRNKPVEKITVDIQTDPGSSTALSEVEAALKKWTEKYPDEHFEVQGNDESTCRLRLRTGKTDLVVKPAGERDRSTDGGCTRRW